MIENEEQYAITANALARFRAALAAFDDRPEAHPGVHSRLIQAQRDAIESQIETLEAEIREWEKDTGKPYKNVSMEAL